MGKFKKVGIGVGVFIIAVFVIGIGIATTTSSPRTMNDQSVIIKQESEIITADASSLLPTRDDLGTTWRGMKNVIYDEAKDVMDYEGFLEKADKHYSRGGGFETEFLDIYIYKFDSTENAKLFYDDFISKRISIGGYEEWFPKGISNSICYGREVTGLISSDKVTIYCVENNVVTFFLGAGYAWDLKEDLQNLAKLIHIKF